MTPDISFAVIFDMDGTLMDNNPYHLLAWKSFCKKLGRELTNEDYYQHISGRINLDIMQYLLGTSLSKKKARDLSDQKEQLYRELYLPHIAPIAGLMDLLEDLKKAGIKTGIASSAQPVNIAFAMEGLGLHRFFDVLVDSTHIKKGKPDPEIFLTTAGKLGAEATSCLVFEDSISGIRGAKGAGMRAIGLTTTHSANELQSAGADYCVADYSQLTVLSLQKRSRYR